MPGALLFLGYGADQGIIPYVMGNLTSGILISLTLATLTVHGIICMYMAAGSFWIILLLHRHSPHPQSLLTQFKRFDRLFLGLLSFALCVFFSLILVFTPRTHWPLFLWLLLLSQYINIVVFLAPKKRPVIVVALVVLGTTLTLVPQAAKQLAETSMRMLGYRSTEQQWVTINETAYKKLQSLYNVYGMSIETCSRTIGSRAMFPLSGATVVLHDLGPKTFIRMDLKPDLLLEFDHNQVIILPAAEGKNFCTLNPSVSQ